MRRDMFKVIVERPRQGGGVKQRKGARRRLQRSRADSDALPEREGMRRAWLGSTEGKRLNENLAPLRRFFASRVGRPWDRVFSELCEALDAGHTVKKHVRDHVQDLVQLHCRIEGERVFPALGRRARRELVNGALYVHPRTGILRRYEREPTRPAPAAPTRVAVDARRQLHRLDGLWFLVQVERAHRVVFVHEDGRITRTGPVAGSRAWTVLPLGARELFEEGRDAYREPRTGAFRGALGASDDPAAHERLVLVRSDRLRERYGDELTFGVSKRQAGRKLLREFELSNLPRPG